MTHRVFAGVVAIALALTLTPRQSRATSHLWRITEIYSNASGTVQFIELKESEGDDLEFHLNEFGMYIETLAHKWYFPTNLDGPTGHRYMLIATPAFASISGAPTPDYLIDPNMVPYFFNPGLDSITFRNDLNAFSFKILTPQLLPLDGVNSLNYPVDGGNPTVGPNSPTNFSRETNQIAIPTHEESFGEMKSRHG
jgi:hypothetical protein